MIEDGNIYYFGDIYNIYFLVVGIENNLQDGYKTPLHFNIAAQALKKKEITVLNYVAIMIKNLRNIKAGIVECDLKILSYDYIKTCKFVKKIDLNRYKTELIKLRLLQKLPCTLSVKDAEIPLKAYIRSQLEKLSSYRIGDFIVNSKVEEFIYLGMETSFYLRIVNVRTHKKDSILVESFFDLYQRNGKHKEIDTTAYTLPDEVMRQSGIVK